MLAKLEVAPRALSGELALLLEKLPKASGGQLAPSPALAGVIREAEALAGKFEDTFVSTEHLLLALARNGIGRAHV